MLYYNAVIDKEGDYQLTNKMKKYADENYNRYSVLRNACKKEL